MKQIAMIKDGVVENIAAWNGKTEWKPEGYDLVDVTNKPEVEAGWLYKGKKFLPPVIKEHGVPLS